MVVQTTSTVSSARRVYRLPRFDINGAEGVFSCEIESASGIPMAGVVIYMGVG